MAAIAAPLVIRPMEPPDVEAADELAWAAFSDLASRRGDPQPAPRTPAELAFHLGRFQECLERDGGGAWIAQRGRRLVGCCLAILRGPVWGLSLLTVLPGEQGSGIGRMLLDRALEYGPGAEGRIILSSTDERALHRYAAAGFTLEPSLAASGRVRLDLAFPDGLREGDAERDAGLVDAVDGAVRGGSHARDLGRMLAHPRARMLVAEGRGYAVTRHDAMLLLAAADREAAALLLRGALAAAAGQRYTVSWLTARQSWALPVVLDARLSLQPDGPVCVQGSIGPLSPYLPSGAWL